MNVREQLIKEFREIFDEQQTNDGNIDLDECASWVEYALDRVREAEPDTSKVTRLEVITDEGRKLVDWDDKNRVELSFQDENRTLKVFITRKQ